jgi:GT2 family glycosyltransferase
MSTVHYILVNYFSDDALMAFADQCVPATSNYVLTIVDNGNNSPETLERFCDRKGFRYLNTGNNLGYFGAAQYAVTSIQGDFDFTIISNFDLSFDSSQLLHWINTLDPNGKTGCTGPDIQDALSKKPMNPMYIRRISRRKIELLILITSNYLFYKVYQFLFGLKRKGRENVPNGQEVYALHGSFLIIHRAYFIAGGNLAHPGFLYGEEIYMAEECRRLGLSMRFDPVFKMVHHEHITTGKSKNRKHMSFENQSLRAIYQRYFLKE